MGEQYQKTLDELITKTKGANYKIPVPQAYIEWLGDLKTALFLTQIVYWAERATRADGGFFKTDKNWQQELGLTKQELKNAKSALIGLNIIRIDKRAAFGHATNHYYLDFQTLKTLLATHLEATPDAADVLDSEYIEAATTQPKVANTVKPSQPVSPSHLAGKTPMPADFEPSQETIAELTKDGYHPGLLKRYLSDCRDYYTVRNDHHRYADWDSVFKKWCSKNPKTDANSQRAERLQELAGSSVRDRVGITDIGELCKRVRDLRRQEGKQAESGRYGNWQDEEAYGEW